MDTQVTFGRLRGSRQEEGGGGGGEEEKKKVKQLYFTSITHDSYNW